MPSESDRRTGGFDRRLFRNRVARRMFVVFVLCALVPVSGFAWYSFVRVSQQLEHDARQQLRAESKIAGMAIIERLALAESVFRSQTGRSPQADVDQETGGVLRSVFAEPGPSVPDELRTHLDAIVPSDNEQRDFLRSDGIVLRSIRDGSGEARLLFVRARSGGGYWIGELEPSRLWQPDTLRSGTHLAVSDADGHSLFASAPEASALAGGGPTGVLAIGDEPFLWESWEVFLRAHFGAPSWSVFELRREADVLAPVRQFRTVFPLVALLAVWIAALLSSAQIRRRLVPIDRLRAATQRIAEGDFDTRVEIETDDEFRELGNAFDDMALRIGDLTRNLETKVAERTQELAATLDELRVTQAQLVHREKMASIGQFVAGIAHEINNPLSFIGGNLHFLRKYTADLSGALRSIREDATRENGALGDRLEAIWRERDLDHVLDDLEAVFDGCSDGVQRTSALVQDLKTFTRLDDGEHLVVDLIEAIDATLNLMRGRLEGVELVREFGDLPPVECLAGQINQVLMNLVSNAIDALDGSGRLVVRTRCMNDDWITIEIEDDGCGMPPEVAERIFDPFYTTKAVGSGTGLGLSVSYGIVQRHGGRIEVSSKPGCGSCFRIELPIRFCEGSFIGLMLDGDSID